MSLNFLQLNMNKAGAAASELHRALPHGDVGVLLLTEPPIYKNKIVTLPKGYHIHPSNTLTDPPRAAILSRPDLNCVPIQHLCNPDCSVALLPTPLGTILLASVYLDGNLDVNPPWLQNVFSYAKTKQYGIILGCDSNAHNTLYGFKTDRRGKDFVRLLTNNDLVISNQGKNPTFDTLRGGKPYKSVIDITASFQVDIQNWRVDKQYNGSDHNSIRFNIQFSERPPTFGRRWSKADWPLFTATLEKEPLYTPRVVNNKKLDHMVDNLYRAIYNALDKACPLHEIKPTKPYSHWYDHDLKTQSKKLRKQYKRAKKAKNREESEKLLNLKTQYVLDSKKKRQTAWRKFATDADSIKSVARFNKILQFNSRHSINLFEKEDHTFTEPGDESLEFLAKTHFPTSTPTHGVHYSSDSNTDTAIPLESFSSWISVAKVRKSLAGFDSKKSPGPDRLRPIIFQYLPERVLSFLTSIYKIYVYLHYTPYLWKQTRVIFIPKPGKDSYISPKSFQPISLSNYFLKALERLCVWRVDYALQYSPLHANQHGFLPGRSTESAISATTNYIEQVLFNRGHCVGIFLDISAAFDSISIEHVRDSLYSHGVDPDLVDWYYAYLQRRDLQFSLHGTELTLQCNLGFPQGGVASAKFWIIAFNPAIEILNQFNILGTGYADDCAALFHAPRIDYAVLQVQKMLDELIAWGRTCNLTFNANKTVAVVFSRSKRDFNSYQLQVDGKYIKYSNSVKYLGVTLDRCLYWKEHIVSKIDNAKKLLFKLKSITSQEWGPSQRLMRWAYQGIVRPMVSYASYVWAHETHTFYIANKLDRLNRLALTLCSQVPKSTPNAALEIMLDTCPLRVHLLHVGLATHYRLRDLLTLTWSGTFSNKTYSTSHRKFWSDLITQNDLLPQQTVFDCGSFLNNPANRRYTVNLRSFTDSSHTCPSQYNLFTDGSRHDDHTGSGYCIYLHDTLVAEDSFRLPDDASVFQAEIYAINRATDALQHFPDAQHVKIHVDSQAALRALDSSVLSSRLVHSTVETLNNIPSYIEQLTLVWTRAHVGTKGNEHADALAKIGCDLPDIHHIPPPLSKLKADLLSFKNSYWKAYWTEIPQAQPVKLLYSGPDPKKAKHLLKLPKKETNLFLITRLYWHTPIKSIVHNHLIADSAFPLQRLLNISFLTVRRFAVSGLPFFLTSCRRVLTGQSIKW